MQSTKGILVVISAPSGGGKTTLSNELLRRLPKSLRSISTTTRPERSTEIANKDYFFVSDTDFDKMLESDEFAEWAKVHGHRYGTKKKTIQKALDAGETLILTIDVQGAKSLKKLYPDAITIFLSPPDFDILETRLRKRGTESDQEIRRRLENARKEIAQTDFFDFQVLNDRLDRAALEIQSIVQKKLEE